MRRQADAREEEPAIIRHAFVLGEGARQPRQIDARLACRRPPAASVRQRRQPLGRPIRIEVEIRCVHGHPQLFCYLAVPVPATGGLPSLTGTLLMLTGLLIQIWAKAALWRSFGVVPAIHPVKTGGPYACA
jgi:hypothetical protein